VKKTVGGRQFGGDLGSLECRAPRTITDSIVRESQVIGKSWEGCRHVSYVLGKFAEENN
jgi:hypothetical protein